MTEEIKRRIRLAWNAFGKLGHIFRSTNTHSSQTWSITKARVLARAHRAYERIIYTKTTKKNKRYLEMKIGRACGSFKW